MHEPGNEARRLLNSKVHWLTCGFSPALVMTLAASRSAFSCSSVREKERKKRGGERERGYQKDRGKGVGE